MHGYILENNKHDIAKGIEDLFNSFNDIDFKKGKLEKAIEKMVALFAKKYNMSETEVYTTKQINNIKKGLNMLGIQRVMDAVNSTKLNSYDILFDEMISVLKNDTKNINLSDQHTEEDTRTRDEIIIDPEFKKYWSDIYKKLEELEITPNKTILNFAVKCFKLHYPVNSCIKRLPI